MASFSPLEGAAHHQSATEMSDPSLNLHNNAGLSDMENDEFVDAPEHQDDFDQPMQDIFREQMNNTDQQGDGSPYDISNITHMVKDEGEVTTLTGIKEAAQVSTKQSRYDPDTEVKEHISVEKSAGHSAYAAAYHAAISKVSSSGQGQPSIGCSGAREASDPPAAPSAIPTQQVASGAASGPGSQDKIKPATEEKVWRGPDDLRDVSKAFKDEKRWHDKIAPLHPVSNMAPHRYWIGVLHRGLQPKNACKETHFTWMKGNRLTTVETVRKSYEQTTMLVGGVFMVGAEKPEDGDRMEELDLFNDKIVLFRILEPEDSEAAGKAITKGLVPDEQVVLLDD